MSTKEELDAYMFGYCKCKKESYTAVIDLMRTLCFTCRYCKYSESACDDEDGYYCHNCNHNKDYLVFSGDFCSYFEQGTSND